MNYFFDTYAIIEIIEENKNYEKYKEDDIITSVLNVGELYYSLLKKNVEAAETWHEKLKQSALLVDAEIIKSAMKFKFENKTKKFSFIDCVGYVIAKERGLRFLTGDEGFENFDNVEFVK
ncbi:PIN domain-containing protein [Candidatus Woesearchaeota archaeon]|nr:PIN domain-containing protein [Candidatus Woesearchaeota archaeon]